MHSLLRRTSEVSGCHAFVELTLRLFRQPGLEPRGEGWVGGWGGGTMQRVAPGCRENAPGVRRRGAKPVAMHDDDSKASLCHQERILSLKKRVINEITNDFRYHAKVLLSGARRFTRDLTWTVRMCFIFLGWHTKVLGDS